MPTSNERRKRFLGMASILVVLVSLILACSSDGTVISLTLKEEDLNEILTRPAQASESDGGSSFRVTNIDMREDYIRVFGDYHTTGADPVSGSFDVVIGAEEGALMVEIISVDIPGLTIEDERIQEINQQMAENFTAAIEENRGAIEFSDVILHEGAVQFVIRVLP